MDSDTANDDHREEPDTGATGGPGDDGATGGPGDARDDGATSDARDDGATCIDGANDDAVHDGDTAGPGSERAASGDAGGDGRGRCPVYDRAAPKTGGSGGSHDRGDHGTLADRTVDRGAFVRTALAIGGTGALAAVSGCRSDGGAGTTTDAPLGTLEVPRGPSDPDRFPERQHAWQRDLKTDDFGNGILPTHQLLLFLDYAGDGTPTAAERERVESAFRTLERAFQRLTGGDPSADNDGLVFMVGYSPTYFDRFEGNLPGSVDLQSPESVLLKTDDDVDGADHFDAVVLLSSDNVPVLLGAEEALFGRLSTLNGVGVRGTLSGVFETAERRTAFTGTGLPRERLDDEHIPEDAPLSMGYKSGFRDNLATEDAVTITDGPFAGGTTFQVSKLRLDLGKWYENDRARRDELMFSHEHSPAEVGDVGEGLEDDSGITEEIVEDLESTARERGRVGHAAKTARARNDDFEPIILRRSEGVNDDFHRNGKVAFNFSAVMAGIEDFGETRKAMDAPDLEDHVASDGHGILPFMEVTNRATFLLPPRSKRALPRARPGAEI